MIRIAVLGAGRIGKIHAANVAGNPRAELVVVADPFAEAAGALAERYKCDPSTDCEAAIDREDVDAIIIGTPTDTHLDYLLRAVGKGKAVMCEKPVDRDIARSRAAVEEIERLSGRVMMAFNRRFDPTSREFRAAIDAGEIGEIRQVIITSRDPELPPEDYLRHSGGIFRDMVIHDFDFARFLLGEEPVEIMAMAGRLVDPGLEKIPDFDTVMVQMRTASGKQCHINCCRSAVYGYDQRFEAFGSEGMLLQDNLRPTTIRRWNSTQTDAREPLLNFFLQRYQESYQAELEHFISALEAGTAMPVTVRDGLIASWLAECAYESIRTGRAVRVQPSSRN
ncbi:inositol 2-dehydrogenase [Azotobacter vinelandii]|uniref:inositol 2-dehydrogenase n=1 Tax=Azotobacter vinelandii TaxID=354 RepID=UPI0007748E9C|nr:inositol 2-dehydrogenase [Azotobacter vinelandii]